MRTAMLLLVAGIALGVTEAEAVEQGEMLVRQCAVCHASDGSGIGGLPPILTMSPDTVLVEFQRFKSGERKGTLMNRIARGYSEEELQAIVEFLRQRSAEVAK